MTDDDKISEELISHRQVFPGDANPAGNMFGGRVMELMDSAGGMAADRFADRPHSVTASVEVLRFRLPIHVGDVLKTVSKVVYAGRTSMVVKVDVFRYARGLDPADLCTSAHFIFVSMDAAGKSAPVPVLRLTTDADREAWEDAKAVRDHSLKVQRIQDGK